VTNGSLPNGIQVVNHGPYSRTYTTAASGAFSGGKVRPIAAVSNVESTLSSASAHQLTPGFAWAGTIDALGHSSSVGLWRVYVFTDKQCVNPVMTGSLVGSPAWAPRSSDPLNMPATPQDLDAFTAGAFPGYGAQGNVFTADFDTPSPSESIAAGSASAAAGAPAPAATTPPTGSSSSTVAQRLVSLPDNGWPEGRYWWTVVPVEAVDVAPASASPGSAGKLEFHDLSLPQDLCAAGQVWSFGMQSSPITTTAQTPYASGLVNSSRVVSAVKGTPSFRELPVVTWEPALAAYSYEIELSRQVYPWVAVWKQASVVTSAVLPLKKSDRGTWYYRVRGVNPNLTGPGQKLAWSKPVAIRITGDIFKILKK
jgi:hypothetical protein